MALAGRFFGMTFPEADEFNAVHGTQFIADLMPRTPIYVDLLHRERAERSWGSRIRAAGRRCACSRHEGFAFDRYIDIFDGGPTVTAATDHIRTIREARSETIAEIGEGGARKMLVATGAAEDFRACCASVEEAGEEGRSASTARRAELLEVEVGDTRA